MGVNPPYLLGFVTIKDVQAVPRDKWETTTLETLMRDRTDQNTVRPDLDATQALQLMQKTATSRLLVADGAHLIGIFTLKDLLHRLAVREALDRTK